MTTTMYDLATRNQSRTPATRSSGGQPLGATARPFRPRIVRQRSRRPADIPVSTCLAWFVLALAFALFVAWQVLS